ncbi:AMP-binding protein [Rheinheimera aquimaris]|uniref:AMP-binding protein n=1 Tax=Rheinheimera aquimaris TaxID=412437 RepID=UPI003A9846B0
MLKQQSDSWQLVWPDASQPVFTDGITVVTAQQWQQQLQAVKRFIAMQPGDTVLLYQADPVLFSAWFVALCQLGKHIVLAPDGQPDTLQLAGAQCDWQAPQAAVRADTVAYQPRLLLQNSCRVSFFTSGSTGQPKLVTKCLSQLLLEVQTLQQQFGVALSGQTLFAATVSFQHIYGLLFRMLWPLCYGFTQHRTQLSYLEQWQALLQQYDVVLVASPAHLARFHDVAILAPYTSRCQRIFSSGGPLNDVVPPRYVAALQQAPTEVFGSTETGGIAYRQRNTADVGWQVFDGVSVSQGPEQALQVSSAYLDSAGWFTTSDQVALVTERSFRLIGRLDRIVKIEEKRLSLPELEQYCLNSVLVSQVAAVVLTTTKPQLALAIVLSNQGEQLLKLHGKLVLNQQIKQHLLRRFERVLLPRKFRYVASLPYNQQGKLPRSELEALFEHD